MNLKHFTAAALALVCAVSFAKEFAPVNVSVKKAVVYKPERFSVARSATISNQFNRYDIVLTLSKPSDKKPTEMKIGFNAGKFGFGSLVNFMKIKANGIDMSKLMAKDDDLQEWKEGNRAGAVIKLNFDGSKFDVIFYMRPDSPVLWCTLKPAADTIEEPENISIVHSCIPSMLAMNGKKVIWTGAPYKREFVTNTRTLGMEPKRKGVLLTKEETSLTFRDATFDGSTADKGQGPVWMYLNHSAVRTAKIFNISNWTAWLELTLDPALKEHKFGFWQQNPRISNADFEKKLINEKAAFTR